MEKPTKAEVEAWANDALAKAMHYQDIADAFEAAEDFVSAEVYRNFARSRFKEAKDLKEFMR